MKAYAMNKSETTAAGKIPFGDNRVIAFKNSPLISLGNAFFQVNSIRENLKKKRKK
jgi:hypothetical protein